MISNQAAALNRCVNKVHEDMQGHIKTLFNDMISKAKSSQKTEKVLGLSTFQKNVIFALGKSMQHMAYTILLQASNRTLTS